MQNRRFKTYPKYLTVVIQRQVVDNWVPKKLEINLTLDTEKVFNFELMKGNGLQHGEQAMPEA